MLFLVFVVWFWSLNFDDYYTTSTTTRTTSFRAMVVKPRENESCCLRLPIYLGYTIAIITTTTITTTTTARVMVVKPRGNKSCCLRLPMHINTKYEH